MAETGSYGGLQIHLGMSQFVVNGRKGAFVSPSALSTLAFKWVKECAASNLDLSSFREYMDRAIGDLPASDFSDRWQLSKLCVETVDQMPYTRLPGFFTFEASIPRLWDQCDSAMKRRGQTASSFVGTPTAPNSLVRELSLNGQEENWRIVVPLTASVSYKNTQVLLAPSALETLCDSITADIGCTVHLQLTEGHSMISDYSSNTIGTPMNLLDMLTFSLNGLVGDGFPGTAETLRAGEQVQFANGENTREDVISFNDQEGRPTTLVVQYELRPAELPADASADQ